MSLREIDTLLFFFINRDLQNSIFDVSMPVITDRYYFFILVLITGLIIKDKKNAAIPILLTVVSVAFSDWTSNILKHLIERARPCNALDGVRLLMGCGDSFSMPSNHAANASAIILALSYRSIGDLTNWKKWMRWLIITVAVLVGFSRIYVGVHYLSDVIVGTAIGIIVSILVIRLYEWSALRYRFKPYNTIFFISLLGISLFRIYYIMQGIIDLSPDEAHYWEWSRRLDLSYYSKGPMIAYLIASGTAVFGDNVFGIRIMAVVFSALSSIVMYLLGKQLFDERIGIVAAILMQVIPLYSAYGVLFTIDSPFIFFWILSLYLFYRAVEQQSSRAAVNNQIPPRPPLAKGGGGVWFLLGVSIGFGLLTKYTMAFFYICTFLFLITSKEHRGLLLTKLPYLSLILSLIVFSPVILWNAGHDWVTLKHTAGQAHISSEFSLISSNWLKNFSEFLGSQIGLISPIIFFMMFYAIFKLKAQNGTLIENVIPAEAGIQKTEELDSRLHGNDRAKESSSEKVKANFLFWFSIPIILFFVLKSLHGKVQANWALPGYATGFIAFSTLFISRWKRIRKWLKLMMIVGTALSLVTTAIAHYTLILKLPPDVDPTARIRGWKELGGEVSTLVDELSKKGPFFIFSDRYQISSELAFYVKGHPVTYCVNLGRRMNQYDLWRGFDRSIHYNAVFVTIGNAQVPETFVAAFDKCDKDIFDVYAEGRKLREYSIFTCYNFKGVQQKGAVSY